MVILDCAAMGDIDVTGALALRGLSADLQGKQTAIVLTELAPGPLRTVADSGVLEEAAYCPRLEEALRPAAARFAPVTDRAPSRVPPAGFEPATPALGERCSIP